MVSISPQARLVDRINIIAQHPESRPLTLPIRAFDPRLKASICWGKFAFGFQARRGKRRAHIAQAHLTVLILSSHDQLQRESTTMPDETTRRDFLKFSALSVVAGSAAAVSISANRREEASRKINVWLTNDKVRFSP